MSLIAKNQGFTMPEILTALAIFMIGIGLLSQVVVDFLKLSQINFDINQNLTDIRVFQEKFIKVSRVSSIDLREWNVTEPFLASTTKEIAFYNSYLQKKYKYSFDPLTKELKEYLINTNGTDDPLDDIIEAENLIISRKTNVDDISFVIQNYGCGDDTFPEFQLNPRITTIIKVLPPSSIRGLDLEPVYFQNTVSQRCIESLYPECGFQPKMTSSGTTICGST